MPMMLRPMQENLLSLLSQDDEGGRVVAGLIDTELFEGEYKTVAERLKTYWDRYGRAPRSHTADLFPELSDTHRRGGIIRTILTNMVQLAEDLNRTFVLDSLHDFVRVQQLKQVTQSTADILQAGAANAVETVEALWHSALRQRSANFDEGLRLTDYRSVLAALQQQQQEFNTGIPELDRGFIVPSRKTVFLFLAPTGKGKTWFMVHLGKMALLAGKKVLHVTLEMGEAQVAQRYYQALFAIPKHKTDVEVTKLIVNRRTRRLREFRRNGVEYRFYMDSPHIATELEQHLSWANAVFEDLVIKAWPPRRLTMDVLDGYLNNVALSKGFVPDIILLDYVGLLKTDPKNHRISLGREFEEFRALCVERNVAGVTPNQVSKAGMKAQTVHETHVAEDVSLLATADKVVSYSSTDHEFRLGLARLRVNKGREERDRFGVLITQSYDIGQFVISSMDYNPVDYNLVLGRDEEQEALEQGGNEDE